MDGKIKASESNTVTWFLRLTYGVKEWWKWLFLWIKLAVIYKRL